MSDFNALLSNIDLFDSSCQKNLTISGVNSEQWAFIYKNFLKKQFPEHFFVFVCESEEKTELFANHLNIKSNILYLGNENNIYNDFIPSENDLFHRFSNISKLINEPDQIEGVYTTFEALSLLGPNKNFFIENTFSLSISDIISPLELSEKLVSLGYDSNENIEEPGQFARRGEVFDRRNHIHQP
jgi:transcription-repair coupling factor (superfamily II helicase)